MRKKRIKRFKHKKSIFPILTLISIYAVLCALIIVVPTSQSAPVISQTKVLVTTQFISNSDVYLSPKDYKKVINRLDMLVQTKGPRAAIDELRVLSKKYQSVFNSCHTIAHAVGRASYQKLGDFTKAMSYQDDLCGSGYVHGIIEAKFKSSLNIYADMQTLCGAATNGTCYHGVGHGLMYFTNNDLPRSLSLCDTYANSMERIRCSEGVFMENFSADIAAHPSAFLHPDDPSYPCAEQSGVYKSVCYFYAPVYFLSLHQHNFASAIDWCKTVEPGYISSCVNGVGSRTMKANMSDPLFVEKVCNENSDQYVSSCIDGMVGYYVISYSSWHKGQELCNELNTKNKASCLSAVTSRKYMFLD